ncbi:MAG: hypothetical protein F6K48_33465, partial [Okeania sp. SIO3H1]|nr:hypothetical protein [Okeania sp. SIO3H1]
MKTVASELQKQITYQPKERMQLLRSLSVGEQCAVFEDLSPYVQQSILSQLKTAELIDLLDHMDMQSAQHTLAMISDEKKRERILKRLKG